MKALTLIGVTKSDNLLLRNKARSKGAYVTTCYDGNIRIQYYHAHADKASSIMYDLFPNHYLFDINNEFFFSNGSEMCKIEKYEFDEMKLNSLA